MWRKNLGENVVEWTGKIEMRKEEFWLYAKHA